MTDFLKHIPKHILDSKAYHPGDSTQQLQQAYDIDIIKLDHNENHFGPSPTVKAAIDAHLNSLDEYPNGLDTEMKEKLAEINKIHAEQIVLGNGSSEVINLIFQLFLQTGGEIIVSEHTYAQYKMQAKLLGRFANIVAEVNCHLNLPAMLSAINNDTRIIVIANPNNPTGTYIAFEQLASFITQVPSDVIVVVDEAYIEYIAEKSHSSVISLLEKHPNLIVTRSFSKAYGLAGLRLGYSISSVEIAVLLNKLRAPFNVNSLSLAAGIAALNDQEHLQNVVELTLREAKRLRQFFEDKQFPIISTTGNFLTINAGKDANNIVNAFKAQGIIIRPLTAYKLPEYIRVTIGTEQQNTLLMNIFSNIKKV